MTLTDFLPVPKLGSIGLILGAILTGAVGVQTWRLHSVQKDLVKVRREFAEFRGGVQALGEDAKRRAALQAAADLRNKERTDEEAARRRADDQRAIARVRDEADRSRRGFLSAVAAATRRADAAEKLRANFERAYRELVQEVRAVGDDGTRAVEDLDNVKDWAARVRPNP